MASAPPCRGAGFPRFKRINPGASTPARGRIAAAGQTAFAPNLGLRKSSQNVRLAMQENLFRVSTPMPFDATELIAHRPTHHSTEQHLGMNVTTTAAQPLQMPGPAQASSKPLVRRGPGALIWQTIVDLGNSNHVATRQVLMETLGLSYTIIDDHVKRMIEDGRVRRVAPGIFEAVPPAPEDRAVSMTLMPGGGGKLEVGDTCLDLTLRELRMIGMATAGVVMQFGR
ncbi:hypothetical protein NU688_33705 [Variovorax sp. ZS18.2.2]|uniref:hypothetical protein n=1 Tax=Variovorax sp. ZS18.2.2 TaxID=2971255 RepID=UPI00215088BD|nr:hypothetical protein [Variovorax sp. ZS18.2.2]MCR6481155.1 hypothetical protein [Variovorax sp. ZS18.2.2]